MSREQAGKILQAQIAAQYGAGNKANETSEDTDKQEESVTMVEKIKAGLIGCGAAGGNAVAPLTKEGYITAAFNTTEDDMANLDVTYRVIVKGVNGSGKDRAFSAAEFKKSYKSFFEHDGIKNLLQHDTIFVVGSGGGGTGTITSVMIAGFLKHEYPDKNIFLIGILGSLKEDLQSQRNMREFMSDLDNRLNCPYLLFDNNSVVDRFGDDVYEIVNSDVAAAIRTLTREFSVENTRSNIDGRDFARLTSFKGMMAIAHIDKLKVSVTDREIDLVPRVQAAINASTGIFTNDPDAYGIYMNVKPDMYKLIDTSFDDIQSIAGFPTSGLVFKHLQNATGEGPDMSIIMSGLESPIERFKQIERRIEEYENTKQKASLPSVERDTEALNLTGDGVKKGDGGSSFLEGF